MKYDIYFKDGKAMIYKRSAVSDYGDLPESKPLITFDENDDWYDWCYEKSDKQDDSIRVCRLCYSVKAEFVNDMFSLAKNLWEKYKTEGERLGWGNLTISHTGMNYTYRESANWKKEKIYYTFSQSLKWDNIKGVDYNKVDNLWARDKYIMLCGIADCVHELGFDLVFAGDLKLHLKGGNKRYWKTDFEY